MRAIRGLPCLLVVLLHANPAPAAPAGKAASLRGDLKDFDVDARWIYDDLERGRSLARRSGRPLLVTFRCVPCDACRLIDFKVRRSDPALTTLLDRFVCVRIVHMRGVDLSVFQFDWDLSWQAVFMHPDGTVYGRYGTRGAGDAESYNPLSSFRRTMERALDLHAGYPGNRTALAGKQGRPLPWRTPEEMPLLQDRAAGPVTRKTCIHCHMIWDGLRDAAYRDGTFRLSDVWVYPPPENLGLEVDRNDGLRVREVRRDSAAARVGLQAGDLLATLDGQPLVSTADVQWALHHASPVARLPITVARGGTVFGATLDLEGDWRRSDISWRASMWSLKPQEKFWAPELTAEERKPYGIPADRLALKVRWIPGDSTAHAAGLKEGDVIVAVDGHDDPLTPSQLAASVRLTKRPGDTLRLTVLRGGRRLVLVQTLH